MSKPVYIAAIDIGTHSTIGAIAEKLPNKTIQIKAVEEVPTRPNSVVQGRIKDVSNTLFEIKSICKKLYNKTNIFPNKVYIYSSWLTKEDNYDEWKRMLDLVNNKRKESMSFIPVPQVMSLKADLFLTPAEQNNGSLLIDMGAGTTSYILRAKGQNDITGMVGIGGWLISNDLTFKGLSFEYAEKLKRKLGDAQPEKLEFPNRYISLTPNGPFDINQSIQLIELSKMIEERVDDTARRFLAKLIKDGQLSVAGRKIVLTGGACKLKHIADWYSAKCRVEVRFADAINFIDSDDLSLTCNKPKYHTLLTLLINGNEDCRAEKSRSWSFRFPKGSNINNAIDNAIETLF